jgi:hypothetical protein
MWILGTIGIYVSATLATVTLIGLVLRSANQFVGESDKDHIKRKVENFWFSTAELDTAESVGRALKSRSRQMKRNIPFFLRLYWLLLLVMFVVVCVENYNARTEDLRQSLKQPVTIDFNFQGNYAYLQAINKLANCSGAENDCQKFDELAWRHKVSRLANLEGSYDDLLTDLFQNHPLWLQWVADSTDALVLVLLAIPLSLGLLFSFNFTLWLLSKITSSSFKLTVMLCVDMFVATAAPVLLYNAFTFAAALIGMSLFGGAIDFTYFDEANVETLIICESSMVTIFSLIGPIVPGFLIYKLWSWTMSGLLLF